MKNAIEIYPILTEENKRLLIAYLADLTRIEHIDLTASSPLEKERDR